MIFLATILGAAVFCAPAPIPSSYWTPGAIVLDPAVCAAIKRAPRDRGFAGFAVFILAHEEGHAHDEDALNRPRLDSERWADCWAASHIVRVAQAVGFSRRQGAAFKREARRFTVGGSYGPIAPGCWR